ncbi:class I SAM-dependent DNA methyltransferase [Actinophytocola sp. KF-1]
MATDFLAATRSSYDRVAADYHEYGLEEMARQPVERAVLAMFASLVDGPVLDVGCGTGLATACLHGLGADIRGVDLSPGMLAVARRTCPGVDFAEASMLALPHADATFAGVMAWYSTIHVPDNLLPTALSELTRVLRPGGHLMLGFQVGDEPRHLTSALGHDLDLVFHRRRPDRMAALLAAAGAPVRVTTVREAQEGELTDQAFLVARKAA